MVIELITDMGFDAQLLQTQGFFWSFFKSSVYKSVKIIAENFLVSVDGKPTYKKF